MEQRHPMVYHPHPQQRTSSSSGTSVDHINSDQSGEVRVLVPMRACVFVELLERGKLERRTIERMAYDFAVRERTRMADDLLYRSGSEHVLQMSGVLKEALQCEQADHEAAYAAYEEQRKRARDFIRELQRDDEHRRSRFRHDAA